MGKPTQEADTDSLIRALSERLLSGVSAVASTAQLALAETRLAATSAGVILALLLLLAAIALVCWLLLNALLAYTLLVLGMALAWVLIILLLLHLLLAGILLLLVRRLAQNIQFRHTRNAIKLRRSVDLSTSDEPVETANDRM